MPEISRFYGLVIKMFFRSSEHNPPHFHVAYGDYLGVINLETLEMEEGDLPPRALKMVKEWATCHKDELLAVWRSQNFRKIDPLP